MEELGGVPVVQYALSGVRGGLGTQPSLPGFPKFFLQRVTGFENVPPLLLLIYYFGVFQQRLAYAGLVHKVIEGDFQNAEFLNGGEEFLDSVFLKGEVEAVAGGLEVFKVVLYLLHLRFHLLELLPLALLK